MADEQDFKRLLERQFIELSQFLKTYPSTEYDDIPQRLIDHAKELDCIAHDVLDSDNKKHVTVDPLCRDMKHLVAPRNNDQGTKVVNLYETKSFSYISPGATAHHEAQTRAPVASSSYGGVSTFAYTPVQGNGDGYERMQDSAHFSFDSTPRDGDFTLAGPSTSLTAEKKARKRKAAKTLPWQTDDEELGTKRKALRTEEDTESDDFEDYDHKGKGKALPM